MPNPVFHIRNIPIYGDAILAPMDGYSDWPFRSICRALGSAMSYSEFVNADDILNRPRYVRHKLTFDEAERPMTFQIYGDSAKKLLEAALRVQELGPDIIDINMGCPAKDISNRGCGVGLMKSPQKIGEIFNTLSKALEVPLTGKIRLGWDDCLSYREVARAVEENGGQLIAVHARTKQQGYGGQANWDAIAEVKTLVKIPVIGNGDVVKVADIQRMKDYTGCDAVMIGRGAIQNPWIFARLDRDQVPPDLLRQTMLDHLAKNEQFYGPEDGQRLFRKHAIQYLLLKSLDREARKDILRQRPSAEFMELLNQVYAQMQS